MYFEYYRTLKGSCFNEWVKFGLEFELAGRFFQGTQIISWSEIRTVPDEYYRASLRFLKEVWAEIYPDDELKGRIIMKPWDKYPEQELRYASLKDLLGRLWVSEPEWVGLYVWD